MGIIDEDEDAFGEALLDYQAGRVGKTLLLEADDGSVGPAMEPGWFFQGPEAWSDWEQRVLASVKGPVLDLGCGAGRAALFLQERGVAVTAVDASPGAVAVCRARGIRDVRLGDLRRPPDDKSWQTILLLCGNLGLGGDWDETKAMLVRLAEVAAPGALLVADTVDPSTDDVEEFGYQQKQVENGHYWGFVRLRLHYGDVVSSWWNQINVAIRDIPTLFEGTGWKIEQHYVEGEDHYLVGRK